MDRLYLSVILDGRIVRICEVKMTPAELAVWMMAQRWLCPGLVDMEKSDADKRTSEF